MVAPLKEQSLRSAFVMCSDLTRAPPQLFYFSVLSSKPATPRSKPNLFNLGYPLSPWITSVLPLTTASTVLQSAFIFALFHSVINKISSFGKRLGANCLTACSPPLPRGKISEPGLWNREWHNSFSLSDIPVLGLSAQCRLGWPQPEVLLALPLPIPQEPGKRNRGPSASGALYPRYSLHSTSEGWTEAGSTHLLPTLAWDSASEAGSWELETLKSCFFAGRKPPHFGAGGLGSLVLLATAVWSGVLTSLSWRDEGGSSLVSNTTDSTLHHILVDFSWTDVSSFTVCP